MDRALEGPGAVLIGREGSHAHRAGRRARELTAGPRCGLGPGEWKCTRIIEQLAVPGRVGLVAGQALAQRRIAREPVRIAATGEGPESDARGVACAAQAARPATVGRFSAAPR